MILAISLQCSDASGAMPAGKGVCRGPPWDPRCIGETLRLIALSRTAAVVRNLVERKQDVQNPAGASTTRRGRGWVSSCDGVPTLWDGRRVAAHNW